MENNTVRTQKRSDKEKTELIHRLNRAEGQIKGIRRMIENDVYCDEVLAQSQAAQAAINSFNKALIKNFAETCVCDDIRDGKDERLDELMYLVYRVLR